MGSPELLQMSYSLNSLDGSAIGEHLGDCRRVIKGDTRSSDYSSHISNGLPLPPALDFHSLLRRLRLLFTRIPQRVRVGSASILAKNQFGSESHPTISSSSNC